MSIVLSFGTKAMWVSIVVIIFMINCIIGFIYGVLGTKKDTTYSLCDSFVFLIFLIIAICWWFAE